MNLDFLCNDIMDFIEIFLVELEEEEEKKEVEFKWDIYYKNIFEVYDEFEDDLDDDDWDEDDYDVEVEYCCWEIVVEK